MLRIVVVSALLLAASGNAFAWRVESSENGGRVQTIRCADNSVARVVFNGNAWTVVSAGQDGKTGGEFTTSGQAAGYGCGE